MHSSRILKTVTLSDGTITKRTLEIRGGQTGGLNLC
jgi:hypothetical protein